jgi:aspartyl-tRNA(Asn)/glutamyl-tRNA(Gln) amidotransferase subunit C
MPRVTTTTVDHVAALANLSLTPEERDLFARQLESILAWAESLQGLALPDDAVDDAAVAPAVPRDDTPRPGLERDRVLEQAPDAADGLFRVPKVIG